jgi:hypothetical protein
MGKGRPGPPPQLEKREQFAALIAMGVSNTEACRTVEINRRTGKRWRHGRTITTSSGLRRAHRPPSTLDSIESMTRSAKIHNKPNVATIAGIRLGKFDPPTVSYARFVRDSLLSSSRRWRVR